MATLLTAADDTRTVTPRKGRAFTLTELQAFVGGYIEALRVPDGRLMYVNEDGKRLRLPLNRNATAIMGDRLRPDDYILGDAVICTGVEAGETDD